MKDYNTKSFEAYFRDYPDKKRYQWFIDVCTYGTDIKRRPNCRENVRLSNNNPKFSFRDKIGIGRQVLKWRLKQYVLGPLPYSKAKELGVTLNRIFAVPKPDGTARPILNLSDRRDTIRAVNDDLQSKWRTVEYIQQKEIIEMLLAAGKGAWMWAKDLIDGFYNISVKKCDIAKLGFVFDGKIYLFQVLPMGLSTSPRIFSDFMHFPLWAIRNDRPEIYFATVPVENVNLAHFRKDSDIHYDKSTGKMRVPLIDSYVDDIIGANYIGHPMGPQFQDATVIVEDRSHPASRHLPERFVQNDEWYSFEASPRGPEVHVLAVLDEATYQPEVKMLFVDQDLRMGDDHPVIWWRCVGRGRAIYSALGHGPWVYETPEVQGLLEGAISWAAGLEGEGCS